MIVHCITFTKRVFLEFLVHQVLGSHEFVLHEFHYSQVPNKGVYLFIPNKKVGLLF